MKFVIVEKPLSRRYQRAKLPGVMTLVSRCTKIDITYSQPGTRGRGTKHLEALPYVDDSPSREAQLAHGRHEVGKVHGFREPRDAEPPGEVEGQRTASPEALRLRDID
jgi:hypothetical protein